LRVLETGQFEMLGSSKTRTASVRVLSATNADLPALIRDGRFREDLYYRLNVIDIAVPPLAVVPYSAPLLSNGNRPYGNGYSPSPFVPVNEWIVVSVCACARMLPHQNRNASNTAARKDALT